MRILATLAFLILGTAAAQAECVPPPTPAAADGIYFPLGIDPTDGILDVWCKLQSLQGDYGLTINFIDHAASRKFPVTFDGTRSLERIELATMIQSLLPVQDMPAVDENGMDFGSVLEMSVQPLAPRSPSSDNVRSTPMGVPEIYDFADDVVLWAPITLDLYPVKIAGIDFRVRTSFRPSFGRYLMAKTGAAEELVLRGWHRNVLRGASPNRDTCPPHIPACKDLGDVIDLNTAWTLNAVTFEARGSGLSNAALQLFSQIAAENPDLVRNPLRNFSPTIGDASFDTNGESRQIIAKAEGDPNKVAGTQRIWVQWKEVDNSKSTYGWVLEDYARRTREAMILNNPSQP